MKVITEFELREIFKKSPFTSFDLPAGMKLTPAAAQFLSERKIKVLRDGVAEEDLVKRDRQYSVSAPTPVFPKHQPEPLPISNRTGSVPVVKIVDDGVPPAAKAEYMTHLNSRELVSKCHPTITFRGKLDTFEALLLELIIEAEHEGMMELNRELTDFLVYCRSMMRAEVRGETLPALVFNGWSSQEIRERSHFPQKYFGVKHFTPQPQHGKMVARLNYLRTQARELELAAVKAFYSAQEVSRPDILEAVNRFSSLIYIFMVKLLAGEYK